jgi:hypothetical protein
MCMMTKSIIMMFIKFGTKKLVKSCGCNGSNDLILKEEKITLKHLKISLAFCN